MQEKDQTLLLMKCRQIMTKRMRSSITGMLNEIDETLLDMAKNGTGLLDEPACYEAIREVRMKRTEIKTRFERRFINLFETELKSIVEHENRETSGYTNILKNISIVDKQNELNVPFENSLGSVKNSCGQILLELDKKMSLLLDSPKSINPMQPDFVFQAFSSACWDIKSGDEVRLMMLDIFEGRIARELLGIYEEINNLLEGQEDCEAASNALAEKVAMVKKQEQDSVMLRYEMIERIENRLQGYQVPDFVRSFLLKHWREFLEYIYTSYSENSIAWNAARQTMDDLIMMVSIPDSQYDRQRQVQLLPSLLFRLINGMKVISLKQSEVDKFLKQLREYQLDSLRRNDTDAVDAITEQAIESVSRTYTNACH